MTSTAPQRHDWLIAARARLSPYAALYPDAVFDTALSAWLGRQIARMTDPGFAAQFSRARAHFGVPMEDFLHRVVRLDAGDDTGNDTNEALTGIRFYGGDPEHAFVDLLAGSGEMDWASALPALLAPWRVFRPRAVRVFAPRPPDIDPGTFSVRLDQGIHAARVIDMPEPDVQASAAVHLDAIDDAGAAAAAVATWYAAVGERNPALREELFPVGAAELETCRTEANAFWIMSGDTRAGLIATSSGAIEMLTGQLIVEEVIAPAHQGNGLAAAAQLLLAAHLAAQDPQAILQGTIFAGNHASRKTAARAGRPALGGYWFVGADTSMPNLDIRPSAPDDP